MIDGTDIYRQKVTRKGVHTPSRWGHVSETDNQPYENVFFYGPFATRNVGGQPYMNADDAEMKVEIQKLEAVPPGTLEWVTEKEKVIERDVSELQ
jgi:hypothetical protein